MRSRAGRLLLVRFGELELDERRRELRAGGRCLAVQPKVFDVLVYLVRERDRVVSRAELLREIWADTAVGPDSITRALREVRRVVGPDRVRTHTSRGVRFVGEVVDLAPFDDVDRDVGGPSMFGRGEALAAIDRALAGTTRTRGGIRIVIGVPGTGKSLLLEEVERRARAAGFGVIRAAPPASFDHVVGEAGTRRQPTVVVYDDLLRDAEASAVDARQLAATVTTAPVVVVAASCTSARRDPRLGAVLATAMRLDLEAIVTLDALDDDALAGMATQVLRRPVSPAALAKLGALTGGNPQLVRHVLHLAKQADRPLETLDALPPSFRDRLRELALEHVRVVGPRTRALLDAVSILDEAFTVHVAAEIVPIEHGEAADAVAEAVALGLLVERSPGHFQFAHVLVRSVIEQGLPPSLRAACHARAAAALERSLGTPRSQLARIARHYVAGARHAQPRALEVVREAADLAIGIQDFGAAARWLGAALEIEALMETRSPVRRRGLWLALAKVLARDGQVERAAEAFAAAEPSVQAPSGADDRVRAAFLAIAPDLPRIVEQFYALLFDRHPQLRPMFTRPLALQRRMFGETIVALVDHVDDDPGWLRRRLGELGRRHAEYGVTDEMYGWARVAFLDAIERTVEARLASQVRETWERTFDDIATAMRAATTATERSVATTPPAAHPRASAH